MTVDSVSSAKNSPNKEQPFKALGLSSDEYKEIKLILGRRPTSSELAIYSVMWSEHCSYKSSRVHLQKFSQNMTTEMKKHLMVGIGQNAGVIDIGEGWAATFKIESHNHPSFIEPFQGAATGVGGIVRDIISMGARPIAIMDSLRFGALDDPETNRVASGVVSGISFYGNCLGLPNIGGETWFDKSYKKNPLVNALAVGVTRHEHVRLANAKGVGNKVILFGARTGADGIGGASLLASETFKDDGPTKRPAVQIGDPFMEKLLIECCQELFSNNVVEAIQDLGAAGISCATSELSANGGSGMEIDLTRVLLRDDTLSPEEILMSESQERMMAIVSDANLEAFSEIVSRWGIESSILGEVTDSGRLSVTWNSEIIVDLDPKTVAISSPTCERPIHRPDWQDQIQSSRTDGLSQVQSPVEIRRQVEKVLCSPNIASKEWITDQYDRYVLGNTALAFPDDSGMVRVDESSGLGIAIAVDGNSRYSYLDPFLGAQLAVSEAFRNVASSGAYPRALSDCLNFGSPENSDVMWQFSQTIEGMVEACLKLEIPVIGGNVSFYNQTDATPILPTPVVAVMGVIDTVERRIPSGWQDEGENIYLLGATRNELDGSVWADVIHGHLGGLPPTPDLDAEKSLAQLLVAAARDGLITSAHDISSGGLITTIVECVLRRGVGARIWLSEVMQESDLTITETLFSESVARVVASVAREDDVKFRGLCEGRGVPVTRIGVTDSSIPGLEVTDFFSLSAEELTELRRKSLPKHLGLSS